jgi:small-conductance mechanosensitive channel
VGKPFKVGDRIQFENLTGDVISIGPRSTRIQTPDSQVVTIPNSKITSNVVINSAMPDTRIKVRIPVSVAYGSDMKKVREILLDIGREGGKDLAHLLVDGVPDKGGVGTGLFDEDQEKQKRAFHGDSPAR